MEKGAKRERRRGRGKGEGGEVGRNHSFTIPVTLLCTYRNNNTKNALFYFHRSMKFCQGSFVHMQCVCLPLLLQLLPLHPLLLTI